MLDTDYSLPGGSFRCKLFITFHLVPAVISFLVATQSSQPLRIPGWKKGLSKQMGVLEMGKEKSFSRLVRVGWGKRWKIVTLKAFTEWYCIS